MAISISEELHLKEIAIVADNYEGVELSDTAFEHTKRDEYNEKVRAKALEKVIKQKEFYEQSLDFRLIPIGIRDSNVLQQATRGARVLDEFVASEVNYEKGISSSSVKYRGQSKSSSFDEIKYEANLVVDFKVEQ